MSFILVKKILKSSFFLIKLQNDLSFLQSQKVSLRNAHFHGLNILRDIEITIG